MAEFGDDFTATPPAEGAPSEDPAADFLAREQEELGDLGEELGLSGGTPAVPTITEDADLFGTAAEVENMNAAAAADADAGGLSSQVGDLRMSTPSPQTMIAHPVPKEEPETIRKWREDHARLLEEKDANEEKQMSELRDQAKKELEDW